MRAILLLALGLLSGCAPTPLPPADGSGWIRLPREAGSPWFEADHLAVAVIGATLTAPSRQRGDPVAQAEALAWFEYATVALNGPGWWGLDPLTVPLLRQGREELRSAYGIRQDAPAQVVVDSFFRSATALSVEDRSGAARSFPPGILTIPGEEVVARLSAPPPLPRVAEASAFAASAVRRMGSGGRIMGALHR